MTTLAEVARHAGVSLATASRVLNGSTRTVTPALRERVLASAAELGYTPNAAAQAMVRGHLDVVGVVVHDIADPYFASIAAGVMQRADEAGLGVAISSTQRTPGREADYVGDFRRQRLRAVVLAGSRTRDRVHELRLDAELERFREGGGVVAAIGQRRTGVDSVVVENRAGARALAEALVGLGYRRMAVLAGPRNLVTAADRLAGFRQGLAAAGLRIARDSVVHGEFTRDGGYRAMGELVARGGEVDCVFAVNDVMAMGAMAALREHGFEVPETIAVAGFDDIATLRDVTPGLTTVRVDLEALGQMAMELILDQTDGRTRTRTAPHEVVIRASSPRRTPT